MYVGDTDSINEPGFVVEILNEGGGEFVRVSIVNSYDVDSDQHDSSIWVCKSNWNGLKDAIDKMIEECRE